MVVPSAFKNESSIARALVQDGILSEDALLRAQRIQSILEEPLSLLRVLVELGTTSDEEVAQAIVRHGQHIRIGDLLVEQGHLSESILQHALQRQETEGGHIGHILVDMGQINERILLRNVARQRNVPYIEPSFPMVETNLLSAASPDFMERHVFVPFTQEEDGTVCVVMNDLENEDALLAVRELYHDRATFALGSEEAIKQTIDDYRRFREQTKKSAHADKPDEDSVSDQVDHILREAIRERASDIHIEPMASNVRLRYRIDGVLTFKTELPSVMLNQLVSRIKVMAEIDIADHLHHQGGRILYPCQGIEYDLRVSIYITVHGENIVIRILSKELGLLGLKEMGMSPALMKEFTRNVLDAPSGVVLITAPTGEGKTTTLYSCLDYSNDESVKIITAEDPVEYILNGVVQCAIHEKAGRTFEDTLREIVRQDPDIVVLGEIRDRPTAQFAIEAALTGHKVYCTFHTEDSVAALLRLIDMGVEPFLISSTVRSILAQRLLRRVCLHCAVRDLPTTQDLEILGLDPGLVREIEFMRGQGCHECNFTGYRGRVAVFESLFMNETVRDAVYNRQQASVLRDAAFQTTGIVNLREDALVKAAQGITTLAEVRRKTPIPYGVRPLEELMRLSGVRIEKAAGHAHVPVL